MNDAQFLVALETDGAAFAASALAAGLTAAVDSCPGWTVADLVWHLAEVHYFWGSITSQKATTWEQVARAVRVPDDELFAFYDTQLANLVQALRTTDRSTPVWTWSDQKDVAFIVRRMAHETAVHRWDAQAAAGLAVAIDAELASDGIDEFLEHMLDRSAETVAAIGGSVHLHCADVAGEWTVRPLDSGALGVTREHAKGDCALRGNASDLLLALWRRVPLTTVDVVGDNEVAVRFVAVSRLA